MVFMRLFFIVFFGWLGFLGPKPSLAQGRIVHIYNWHNYMPQSVLDRFTAETGIQVAYDVYDSNEMLEAKLLTGGAGYDVVFPTAWPFLARQIAAGLYRPLDLDLIPHYKGLSKDLLGILDQVNGGVRHAIPFLWGVSGLAYNRAAVARFAPNAPTDSWGMIFDPAVVSAMAPCGVVLPDDPDDLFLAARLYLGLPADSDQDDDLRAVEGLLRSIRPFVRRFDSARSNDDIAAGHMCLVQHWLGSVAASSAKLTGHKDQAPVTLVVPKEGAPLWMDVVAIPASAPHVAEAHAFINFILRPDNMAAISNGTFFANPVPASLPMVREEVRSNDALYPSPQTMKRLFLGKIPSMKYYKRIGRIMTRIRSNRAS